MTGVRSGPDLVFTRGLAITFDSISRRGLEQEA